jgi:hypothetical protein
VNDLLSKGGSDAFFISLVRRDGPEALAGGDAGP